MITAYALQDLGTLQQVAGTILILRPERTTDDSWTLDLEQLGYTVLSAEEPGQALVHVRTGSVDLVVIDGTAETCDVVAGFVSLLGQEKHAPPFVLASSCPEAPQDSARLGAAAFLPKPCHAGDVTHVLARVAPKTSTAEL